jgi:hypothetical protein
MIREVVLAVSAVSTLALLGCGGGGSDDSGLVAIHRIELDDVDPAFESQFTPPPSLLGRYPAAVADVNGKPISGDALVAEQIRLAFTGRQLDAYQDMENVFPEAYINEERSEIESTDPLESLIDKELLRQAVERLGLLPSHEEAEELARAAEEAFLGRTEGAENREGLYETLRVLGWPDHDWASNEKIVETYRRGTGMTRLRKEHCEEPTPQPVTALLGFHSGGYDCSAFLAQERESADIVYYVRWAD